MSNRLNVSVLSVCGLCALLHSAALAGGNNGTACPQPGGPNLIVGDITGVTNYAAEPIGEAWHDALSLGLTVCNIGDANASYAPLPSGNHPVYVQHLYRLKNGRLEQIGLSWAWHGQTAAATNQCGCGCNGVGGTAVGQGCSNPHSASALGFQTGRNPRWQVNAFTGSFATSPANPPFAGSTARRLRVKSSDLEPSSAATRYFGEYMLVAPEEVAHVRQYDNAGYREVVITGGPEDFSATTFPALTVREQPAIRAWKASDPEVVETDIHIAGEGLFILAAKATHVSGNVWNYEYALLNYNSDLSGRAFRVPLPPGAVVTNVGFHDVDYHSGDAEGNFTDPNLNFSGEDWTVTITNDSIEWATQSYAQNINANALRWGTMYNFRFNVNRAPHNGNITIATFKVDGEVLGATVVPAPAACAADIAPSDEPDGTVNVVDLLGAINAWGECVPGNCGADTNGDGVVNVIDLLEIINSWGACP